MEKQVRSQYFKQGFDEGTFDRRTKKEDHP
jgi:hypothetical protein